MRIGFVRQKTSESMTSGWRRRMACRAAVAGRSGRRLAGPGRVSKLAEPLHEKMLRDSWRPRLPARKLSWRKRIVEKRLALDAERLDHVGSAPADDVERFAGSGETIGPLVLRVILGGPWRQLIARVDSALQAGFGYAKGLAQQRFQRRDAIPTQHKLGGVVQEFA